MILYLEVISQEAGVDKIMIVLILKMIRLGYLLSITEVENYKLKQNIRSMQSILISGSCVDLEWRIFLYIKIRIKLIKIVHLQV